jgi:hypothetical protein
VWVTESHTDDFGGEHRFARLALADDDHEAVAVARQVELLERLRQDEVNAAIDDGVVTPRFQTASEFISRWREKYRSAEREECARMARWLIAQVDAGRVTVTQLRAAFALTAAQWTALRDRMVALRDHLVAIENAKGE